MYLPNTILIVDDEDPLRASLVKTLRKEGYEVLEAPDGETALELIRREPVSVVLTDLKMPGMDGVQLLKAIKAISPEVEVILMTAYGTIETAVEAMREGAYDYIEKPLRRAEVLKTVANAMERQVLLMENRYLHQQLQDARGVKRIIGQSEPMRRVMEIVQQVAPSSATVLIEGESGTGKEVIANAIHYSSPRRDKPFIKVSCAALPETLLESELFGYERGAFTGAEKRKPGRFELADGGTLFLDEIGLMPLHLQVKLLRVLQEHEFERLGGTQTIKVDVRLIAATNVDLAEAVRNGLFREDLFYRLNVINIKLPPLRERKEDIPLLVDHFIRLYSEKNSKPLRGISKHAMAALIRYNWPGNVRELENVIERAVVLSKDEVIDEGDLPRHIVEQEEEPRTITIPIGTTMDEVERIVIEETLKHTKGNKMLAAKLLGISYRTIYRKLNG
jgi:two-component system response regulator HydG